MFVTRYIAMVVFILSAWKGARAQDDQFCLPVQRLSTEPRSFEVERNSMMRGNPGKRGATGPVGPQGPRGITGESGGCACNPSEIEQISARFEALDDIVANLTAMLQALNRLHHHALKVDLCDHKPCKNGGICIRQKRGFACNCTDDYEGQDCSIRIKCTVPMPPQFGTVSRESNSSIAYKENITFTCDEGHKMVDESEMVLVAICQKDKTWSKDVPVCIVDQCAPDSCSGKGTCVNQLKQIVCKCDEGYEGRACSMQSDPCISSPCGERGICSSQDHATYTCQCNVGYEGNDCSEFNANLCSNTVGMEDGRIADDDITASRTYANDNKFLPRQARLRNAVGSWVSPSPAQVGDWLQVDLKETTTLVAIITQGFYGGSIWVTSYKVSYGLSEDDMQVIQDDTEGDLIFQGNRDHNSLVRNNFPSPVTGRYFRIIVQSWQKTYAILRIEYITC
ncbi:unnamed protein product [Clavelina lepadiformis]|uniref:Uncharacterized protein n=1 Tax=Clavelina lepadiformis TaxID=159417 RepID=A0ABP0FB63_CLALP